MSLSDKYVEALGMLTTLAPHLEIDSQDPIGMAKVIEKSVIPPTANLENVDDRCDRKMDYVPGQARQANVGYAMSNSLGFGGHNCCLVVGKV